MARPGGTSFRGPRGPRGYGVRARERSAQGSRRRAPPGALQRAAAACKEQRAATPKVAGPYINLCYNLWILATIGATAPFIGLFGTVVGIIGAFDELKEVEKGGLDVVSGGISVALYATAAGIFVAIEAVILYNFFNQRLARTAVELRMMTDEFLELLDEQDPEKVEQAKRKDKDSKDSKDKDHGSREAA